MIGETRPYDQDSLDQRGPLDDLRQSFEMQLERQHQDNYHCFRSDVTKKLRDLGALNYGLGWAVFYVDDSAADPGSLAILKRRKEVLLLTQTDCSSTIIDDVQVSTIRILTNECVIPKDHDETAAEWISYDVTVDSDGNAAYFVDSILDEQLFKDDADTYASIFIINNAGQLGLSGNTLGDGIVLTIPLVGVPFEPDEYTEPSDGDCQPFGDGIGIDSKMHALMVAKTIFAEIKDLDPAYKLSLS